MKKQSPVIGIIGGTGRMGSWFKNFFESEGLKVLVSGRKTKLTSKELTKKSDIVIVSVPICETESVIEHISPFIKKESLLTDIASLKGISLKAMETVQSGTLGMHPLFGPTVSITYGLKIIFCKQKNNQYVDFLKSLFEKKGIVVIEMGAEEHDYHMAYVQALTHSLNLLYAKIIFDQKDALSKKIDTPLFMLQSLVMGRVLHQDLGLSADIEFYNPYFIPLLENLAGFSKKLLNILQEGNHDDFIAMFKSDRDLGLDFANYSTLHTDKILKLVSEVHTNLPKKIVVKGIPSFAKISYLGPEGTYSHQVAETVFSKKTYKKFPSETIFTVFDKVTNHNGDFGIIPAENSSEGAVSGTLDYLVDFPVFVVGSLMLPIRHQLASVEKKLENIETIVSHPQAIAQCKQWIKTNLPNAKIVMSQSTTTGLSEKKKGHGYICSDLAAKQYKAPILSKNIEDNPNNTTRFYIISKNQIKISGLSNKKTLIFFTVYNRVGVLRDVLNVLAEYNLDLTRLESRPSIEKVWDYHFFVEIEKEYDNPTLKKALKDLEKFCPVIRILGQT